MQVSKKKHLPVDVSDLTSSLQFSSLSVLPAAIMIVTFNFNPICLLLNTILLPTPSQPIGSKYLPSRPHVSLQVSCVTLFGNSFLVYLNMELCAYLFQS